MSDSTSCRALEPTRHRESFGCRGWHWLFHGSLPLPITEASYCLDGSESERTGFCLSANCAVQRLRRTAAMSWNPSPHDATKFDSVGLNYLLHCLPGSIESNESKAVAFDHLRALMNPHAVLFGSTLLQSGVRRNWLAKRLMDFYNKKGIFSNQHDSLDGLKFVLDQRFRDVSIEVVGCAALFSGRV